MSLKKFNNFPRLFLAKKSYFYASLGNLTTHIAILNIMLTIL